MVRMGLTTSENMGSQPFSPFAQSQVLVGGEKGDRFALSRLVHKESLLAPYLLLFFTKAMSIYLTTHDFGLEGLSLLLSGNALLDLEFTNDTAIYLRGHKDNLTHCLHCGVLL